MTDDQPRYVRMDPGTIPDDWLPPELPDDVMFVAVMMAPAAFDPATVAAAAEQFGELPGVVGGGLSLRLNCHPLAAAESMRAAAAAIEHSYREQIATLAADN